jgi:hypothetical protein
MVPLNTDDREWRVGYFFVHCPSRLCPSRRRGLLVCYPIRVRGWTPRNRVTTGGGRDNSMVVVYSWSLKSPLRFSPESEAAPLNGEATSD